MDSVEVTAAGGADDVGGSRIDDAEREQALPRIKHYQR